MEIDAFKLLKTDTIKVLQKGFVKLIECNPRFAIESRGSIEHSIVQFARTSTLTGLKTIEDDNNLIRYLYENRHTSPFESVEFTFLIKCPLFVAIHFLRHRTASINQQSARYSKITDEFYTPTTMTSDDVPGSGIRMQSMVNKQSSDESIITDEVFKLFEDMEAHTEEIYKLYEMALKKGVAREVARFCIPQSVFTEFHYKMDLNNLLKLFSLRCEKSAQAETRVVANAMLELIKDLIPVTYECFMSSINGMSFSDIEVLGLSKRTNPYPVSKKRKREEFERKAKSLNIDLIKDGA